MKRKGLHIIKRLSTVVLTSLMLIGPAVANNNLVVIPMFGSSADNLKNVITVAKQNADFTDPLVAMESIDDAASENPYVMVIGPGIFELGNEQFIIKNHVSVRGSGQGITTLKGSRNGASEQSGALLVGANNSMLSDLSIVNSGSSSGLYRVGILIDSVNQTISRLSVSVKDAGGVAHTAISIVNANPSLRDVLASASDASGGGATYNIGIKASNSSAKLSRVATIGTGGSYAYGLQNDVNTGDLYIEDSTLMGISGSTASFGLNVTDATPFVRDSRLIGTSKGVNSNNFATNPKGPQLAYNEIQNGVAKFPLTTVLKCIGNYNENLNPISC